MSPNSVNSNTAAKIWQWEKVLTVLVTILITLTIAFGSFLWNTSLDNQRELIKISSNQNHVIGSIAKLEVKMELATEDRYTSFDASKDFDEVWDRIERIEARLIQHEKDIILLQNKNR